MRFARMAIEAESPEELGYGRLRYNLAESSVRDRSLAELGIELADLTLAYTDHRGRPDLRAAIAGRAGGGLGADDILVTAGAAAALFLLSLTLLEAGDRLVVARPNYATNIATPRALGCEIAYLDLALETGFAVDVAALAALVGPSTRLISLTSPHNPTGVAMSAEALAGAAALAERRGARLLIDETYRDMAFAPLLPLAATLSPAAISVGSLSKSFGVPGIRVGWIACRDTALMADLLAAKEQIGICGSVVDEAIAAHVLAGADTWLAQSGAALGRALRTVSGWMAGEPRLEWVRPTGGCVCFPRVRAAAGIDMAAFHRVLLEEHAALVAPGHWFDQDERHFRIGFGWPTAGELAGGLAAISAALDVAQVSG